MSTDRELLELAAKAVGYSPLKEIQRFSDAAGGSYVELVTSDGFEWNPLTDDGDALRLATKLLIQIYPDADGVEVFQMEIGYMAEPSKGDLPAATRRAIVKAAAEVGETK